MTLAIKRLFSLSVKPFFVNAVSASLWVTRIFMIFSLGTTLAGTAYAFYGAIKEEASKTSSIVGGNFIGAGNFHFLFSTCN